VTLLVVREIIVERRVGEIADIETLVSVRVSSAELMCIID